MIDKLKGLRNRWVSKPVPSWLRNTGGVGPFLGGGWVHLTPVVAILRYLQPGSTILDFGCGPCDKTAVLQFLDFHCSACDDLQDDWHKIPGNREKIHK